VMVWKKKRKIKGDRLMSNSGLLSRSKKR